jgi:para-nitrobenzyl esterase
MTSPLAKDLFQKVIIESGILFDGPPGAPKTLQQLEANGVAAAKAWGVSSADAAALRQVPTDQVFASALPGSRGLVTWPILDGKVVPEDLRAAFEAGHIAHGPLLLGTNSYEAGFFALRQAAEGLSRRFAAQWPKVQQLYDGYGTHQTAGIEAELATDVLFTVSTRRAARAAAAHGVTTYLYRFSYLRPLQEGQVFGAIHGDEVYAVFGTMGLVEPHTSVGTRHIIEEIQSRWVQFATAGRPTEDPSRWPRFKLSAERLQDFTNAGPLVRTDYARARLDLAAALMAATPSP